MMKEHLQQEISAHVRNFFLVAKLNKKKWYREIKTFDELLYSFFVIRRRMIQSKKYLIHESKEIRESNLKPEVLRDYNSLKKELTEKGDLKKFHTENSKILYPIDSLLEDYNINHLHLDRCRYQAFFLAEGTDIFIIQICKHFERNHTKYSKNNLLEIIGNNWPEKIKNKTILNNSKNININYSSLYGWAQVDLLHNWINNSEKSNNAQNEIRIDFIDNEKFIVKALNRDNEITSISEFEV